MCGVVECASARKKTLTRAENIIFGLFSSNIDLRNANSVAASRVFRFPRTRITRQRLRFLANGPVGTRPSPFLRQHAFVITKPPSCLLRYEVSDCVRFLSASKFGRKRGKLSSEIDVGRGRFGRRSPRGGRLQNVCRYLRTYVPEGFVFSPRSSHNRPIEITIVATKYFQNTPNSSVILHCERAKGSKF